MAQRATHGLIKLMARTNEQPRQKRGDIGPVAVVILTGKRHMSNVTLSKKQREELIKTRKIGAESYYAAKGFRSSLRV